MGLMHGVDVWIDTGKHTVNSALLVSLKTLAEDSSWTKQYDCVL